jgi:hypothetical protein
MELHGGRLVRGTGDGPGGHSDTFHMLWIVHVQVSGKPRKQRADSCMMWLVGLHAMRCNAHPSRCGMCVLPSHSDSKGYPASASYPDLTPPACPNKLPSDPYAAYPYHGAFVCHRRAASGLTFRTTLPRQESGAAFSL